MPNTMLKPHYYLAVLLFVVTAFLLSVVPIKAKSALGSSGFSAGVELKKVDSKALTLLEKSLSYRLAVLENSDVPEGNLPPVHNRNLSDVDGEFGVLPRNATVSSRVDFENYANQTNLQFREGWSAERVYDDVVNVPNGSRPPPSTYLSESQIKSHLSNFDEGIVRITSKESFNKRGTVGPDGGFVLPKSQFDKILTDSKGDLRIVEQRLGLDRGYLSGSDTLAVHIKPENVKNLRIPTGNEGGANGQWIPGGYTNGGVPEAVADFSHKPPVTVLNLK